MFPLQTSPLLWAMTKILYSWTKSRPQFATLLSSFKKKKREKEREVGFAYLLILVPSLSSQEVTGHWLVSCSSISLQVDK